MNIDLLRLVNQKLEGRTPVSISEQSSIAKEDIKNQMKTGELLKKVDINGGGRSSPVDIEIMQRYCDYLVTT